MQSKRQGEYPEVKKERYGFSSSSDKNETFQDSESNSLDGMSEELTDDASSDEHDENVQSCEKAPNEIVVYNPKTSDAREPLSVFHPPDLPKFAQSNHSTRVLPSVGEFAVQCASCFKWRLIPTKGKYEEIRQNIKEEPFVCETAREWRPDISCDDPADISQDGSRIWAIDKPSISRPPTGWQRLVKIRGEGGTRFADVYYVAPNGKTLRSRVEVQKYLLEHPELMKAGVKLSQFSFQIPKPLQDNYVRRCTYKNARQQCDDPAPGQKNYARKCTYKNAMQQSDATAPGILSPHEPAAVSPISWAAPAQSTELPVITGPDGASAPSLEAPDSDTAEPPLKKQAIHRLSKSYTSPKRNHLKVKQSQQARNDANAL